MNDEEEFYQLDELIEILERIKLFGEGNFNFPKSIYCLSMEIKKIKEYLDYFHDIIPQKYKKFNPKPNESPFFTKNDLNNPVDPIEYEQSKKRMADLLKQIKQEPSEEF